MYFCKDKKSLKQLIKNIVKVKDQKGKIIFKPRYQNLGNSLNISIQHSATAYKTKKFVIKEKAYKSQDLNIDFVKRDIELLIILKKVYLSYGEKSKKLFKSYGSKKNRYNRIF